MTKLKQKAGIFKILCACELQIDVFVPLSKQEEIYGPHYINGKKAFSDIVLDRKIESLTSNSEEPQIELTSSLFSAERA